MSVGIYTCRDECKNLLNVDWSQIKFYDWPTEQEFFDSKHDYKIAAIEFDYGNQKNFVDQANLFLKCDLVLVYSLEATQTIVDLIKQFDLPNFVFVINAVFNFELSAAKVVPQMDWMASTANFYIEPLKQVLEDKLIAFAPKPYMFEVMYGLPRRHRSFVSNRLLNNTDQFYQTPYFTTPIDNQVNQTYNFGIKDLWEDEMVPSLESDYECSYQGQLMKVSQVLPFKIYNKTVCSLVCETQYSNQISFFTEKIAKPIIAHRLFIVISGQHYLKNLRSLGFKTFDGIIDESYDNIEDHETRWNMAVDQAILLSQQDQQLILKKIIPIALYNFDRLTYLFKRNAISMELELFLLDKGYYKK